MPENIETESKNEKESVILERLSATQTNMRNHDENSSSYTDTCYKEYYAIIMTLAPNLIKGI